MFASILTFLAFSLVNRLFHFLYHQSGVSQGCLSSLCVGEPHNDIWSFSSLTRFISFDIPVPPLKEDNMSHKLNTMWSNMHSGNMILDSLIILTVKPKFNCFFPRLYTQHAATLPLHLHLRPARHECHPQIALFHCCVTNNWYQSCK